MEPLPALLNVTAAEVEPVELEHDAQDADGTVQTTIPAPLPDLLERPFAELLLVGLLVSEGVVRQLERREGPSAVEQGGAEPGAERDDQLDPLATDGRKSLDRRVPQRGRCTPKSYLEQTVPKVRDSGP